jgi:Tfp pilus assembly protein PilF
MRAAFAAQFPGFRLESGAQLTILAPRDERQLKELTPRNWKGATIIPTGYFQHGWDKEYAVVRLDQVGSDRTTPDTYYVVDYEYVHGLLHANFRWLPTWLDVGLSEFYAYTRFERSRMFIGAPPKNVGVIAILNPGSLIPLETLLTVNPFSQYPHDERKVQLFYAEAWLVCHFLTFGPGMEQGERLKRFYNLLQRGMDEKKAFEQAIGSLKQVENDLNQYLNKFAFATGEVPNPVQIGDKDFAVRTLTAAETEAELGSLRLWAHDVAEARGVIEAAVRDDPNLGAAHEGMGFLDFADLKDTDAIREFTRAYELDHTRYLSLFAKTMLSPAARSDAPADQADLHDSLLKTLDLNPDFAPAYVQLARQAIRQGDLARALALARKAEQLEPSRAGYHLLSGQILLRLGRGNEAASYAQYVAERWGDPDHDEAVELWNSVPAQQRSAGDAPVPIPLKENQKRVEGVAKSVTCDDKTVTLMLDHEGQTLTFRANSDHISTGFSDTLWYGEDHYNFCRHGEGLRVVVQYLAPSDASYTGNAVVLAFRDDLAPVKVTAVKAQPEEQKQ